MIREPDRTEVIPTRNPPSTPISSVGTGRTTGGDGGAPTARQPSSLRLCSPPHLHICLGDDGGRSEHRATPSAVFTVFWVRAPWPSARRTRTPRNADGTEPTTGHFASGRLIVPSSQVHRAADRSYEQGRDEAAADGRERLDPEEEHEHGSHKRTAAHTRKSDDRSDEQPGQSESKIDVGHVASTISEQVRWDGTQVPRELGTIGSMSM